eukprot:6470985-Amphidinium_carterae.2
MHFTKDQCLKRYYVPTCQTTKASERRLLLGLGKACMLQTLPPRFLFWGWGRFKQFWFKRLGHPAIPRNRLDTTKSAFLTNIVQARLDTTEELLRGSKCVYSFMSVDSLQPFEHKHSDFQPCRFLRAATLSLPGL